MAIHARAMGLMAVVVLAAMAGGCEERVVTPSALLQASDEVFLKCLPMGRQSRSGGARRTAAGGVTGSGFLGAAEMRFTLELIEGQQLDLEQSVNEAVDDIRGMGFEVEHEQTRNSMDGQILAGTITYGDSERVGEISYLVAADMAGESVDVELSVEEEAR